MTVVNSSGLKVEMPRLASDDFWQAVESVYAPTDTIRWKYVAMLALQEVAEWPANRIARAFGVCDAHAQRGIDAIRQELSQRLAPNSGDEAHWLAPRRNEKTAA